MYNKLNDSIVPNYAKSQKNWGKFFLEKKSDSLITDEMVIKNKITLTSNWGWHPKMIKFTATALVKSIILHLMQIFYKGKQHKSKVWICGRNTKQPYNKGVFDNI